MPWSIQKKDNKFCVVKDGDGSSEGCHDTKSDAEDQMKALYASENKNKMGEAEGYYPMWGVTSFAELDDLQQAREAAHEMGELLEQFRMIASNIVDDTEITDKAGAIMALMGELTDRIAMEGDTEDKGIVNRIKEAVAPLPESEDIEVKTHDDTGFMVWKEAGQYRWFAVYSNKFRDEDYPPEIISEKSHRTFAEMASKNIVPMPELWQWHIPGTRWGVADWVDVTDAGFALASGTVDDGCESIAESYAKDAPGTIKVSHGMPKSLLLRDAEDDSVITFHVTTEISPLPADKAANPYTGFHLLSEVKQMSISQEQREYLEAHGLKSDAIEQISQGLTQLGKQAEGRESKNKDAAAEEVVVDEVVEVADEVVAPDYVTREELAQVLSEVVSGVQTIGEAVKSLNATVTELQQADGVKIAKAAENTPAASLSALIAASVIGKSAAQVDGRTSIAKDGPKQTESKQTDGLFFEEWTNSGVTLPL